MVLCHRFVRLLTLFNFVTIVPNKYSNSCILGQINFGSVIFFFTNNFLREHYHSELTNCIVSSMIDQDSLEAILATINLPTNDKIDTVRSQVINNHNYDPNSVFVIIFLRISTLLYRETCWKVPQS